jgi:hypothetical protein
MLPGRVMIGALDDIRMECLVEDRRTALTAALALMSVAHLTVVGRSLFS